MNPITSNYERPLSIENTPSSGVEKSSSGSDMPELKALGNTVSQVIMTRMPDQPVLHQVVTQDFNDFAGAVGGLSQPDRKEVGELLKDAGKDIKSAPKKLLDVLKLAISKGFNAVAKAVTACMTWVAHALQTAFKFAKDLFKVIVEELKNLLEHAKSLPSNIKAEIKSLISSLSEKKEAKEAPSMSETSSTRRSSSEGTSDTQRSQEKTVPRAAISSGKGTSESQKSQGKTAPKETASSSEPKRNVQENLVGAEFIKQLTSDQRSLLISNDRLPSEKAKEKFILSARVLGFRDPASCNISDIRKAYRSMALQLHPDKNPGADTNDQFSALNSAHDFVCQNAALLAEFQRAASK